MDSINSNTESLCRDIAKRFQDLPREERKHDTALESIRKSLDQLVKQVPDSPEVKTLLGMYHYELFAQGISSAENSKKLVEYMTASVDTRSSVGWWFKATCTKVGLFGYSFTPEEEGAFNLMKMHYADFSSLFDVRKAATMFIGEFC